MGPRALNLLLAAAAACAAAATAAPAASGSELIDRDARDVRLRVGEHGEALLTYRVGRSRREVLAWGAVNAVAPTSGRPQARFRLDYSGGRSKAGRAVLRRFRGSCKRYDGPKLAWLVTACKAPDGSYWAVQSWQRMLPNYGLAPTPAQRVWELRLSHWRGPLAQLEIGVDWAYRRYDHLYGRLTYRGSPVYGFRSSPMGVPLDAFGRNIYVDTFNSAYGSGWRRENSFLAQTGTGSFCYGFYARGTRPPGKGERYRATVIGPGVTPDVSWESPAPGPYDGRMDEVANRAIAALGSQLCRPN